MTKGRAIGLALAFIPTLSGCFESNTEIADTIYLGRNIITMDDANPIARAVAVKDGIILSVGSREKVLQSKGPDTQYISLDDHALLPGFIDAHGHVTIQAQSNSMLNVAPQPVGPVDSIDSLKSVLTEYAESNDLKPGEWIIANGYDDALLAEHRHPSRRDLDAAVPDNPVVLLHVSLHMAVCNSAALDILDINHQTPSPAGGEIERFSDSREPTGLLKEAAMMAIFSKMPTSTMAESQKQLVDTLSYYAQSGITTVQEGAMSPDGLALLQTVAESKKLVIDVVGYPHFRSFSEDALMSLNYGNYENNFKIGGIKIVLDGSPQGKTAYLTMPYLYPPEDKPDDYLGYPQVDQDKLTDRMTRYYAANIPVLAHANGDAAADQLIDAVEIANTAHPGDHRTVMIHAQTVREDQLDEMNTLGIVPSYFSAHTFYWGDWHRDSVFGLIRASRISPTASTVSRNMPFTIHNDSPVVPPDMMRLIWATVNRQTRSGKTLGADQRISVENALKAVTIHAAYQYFEEDTKGSITPGKVADFVILSENPLTADPTALADITIEETVFRGRTIYRRDWVQTQ